MGSPFLILESDVYGLTLIQSQGLNYYIRCFFWVIPASLGETRNHPKRAVGINPALSAWKEAYYGVCKSNWSLNLFNINYYVSLFSSTLSENPFKSHLLITSRSRPFSTNLFLKK